MVVQYIIWINAQKISSFTSVTSFWFRIVCRKKIFHNIFIFHLLMCLIYLCIQKILKWNKWQDEVWFNRNFTWRHVQPLPKLYPKFLYITAAETWTEIILFFIRNLPLYVAVTFFNDIYLERHIDVIWFI